MDSILPLLAVETSGYLCSIALMKDENVFIELNYLQKHIHSEKIIGMFDDVLRNSMLGVKDLKSIAISIGPGSFTGLRIGLSAVKGIAFGNNFPLVPVPTHTAYAYQISNYLVEETTFSVVSNTNIDELYYSRFVKKKDKLEVIEELSLISKTDVPRFIKPGENIYGNVNIQGIINPGVGLTAASIGKWAYLFGKDLLSFDYDYLEPNYFKKFVAKVKS
jgi:tRNA threonylcarbamoyladenosine biosynthesis protein TsaB